MIICKNCTAKLFNQTVQDEEVVIAEKEMSVNDFESATDSINQSFQLFDSSPLKAVQPDRTLKLGNITKLILYSSQLV